jgi:hypothetical protein
MFVTFGNVLKGTTSSYRDTDKYVWTSPDRKTLSRIGYFLMLASGRWHSSVLIQRSFL